MRKFLTGIGAAVFLAACAGGAVPGIMLREAPAVTATSPHIMAALADPRRPQADRDRDQLRHPADIMAFAGVQPGWRIADVGPGGGYYSRLFAVAVGDSGRVYGVDRPNAAPDRPRAMLAVVPQYSNITELQAGYTGWTIDEPLDAVFISQIYHDFFYPQLNVDVPGFNRAVFNALKPGGVLIIIDHAAEPGHTINLDPQADIHRIDQAQVIREVTAAGFVLEAESQVLRNPGDHRTERVFEQDIRGHTDQFVLRFRKPG
ncbi:class I SAM-dependent methyltransferase [Terricaulis sp.]|uniref:class I SAM-dependent methyltransferase n=1 Tax=Terricaulis sp. TaxID=2768686 RepID=UPI0037845C72